MPTSIRHIIAKNDLIRRAYAFAKHAHAGEKRKNGEPYFNHCIATAETLSAWGLDETTIAAGFLHETPKVQDEATTLRAIEHEFGKEIAAIVASLIAIGKVPYRGTEGKVENLRRFIIYLSQDIRVMLVKFAARLDTMKSLYIYPNDVQQTIALKTMEVYAPLANQLGMYRVARDLEDLAFPYLYPDDYRTLIERVREQFEERERYLERLKPMIVNELKANGVLVVGIETRAKHYFSLFKKMLRYDMDIEKVYDLVAVRLLVPTIGDCYQALGVIHRLWQPISGRIKDYIAAPKPNGYQSLHTTVATPEERITEIQIRTPEMHEVAEFGIAAHYAYERLKGTASYRNRQPSIAEATDLTLTRELRAFPKALGELSFFKNRILVLTPKGDVIDLPNGGTLIDFAYRIHSDLGNRASGAKVNGKIVPLHAELRSGDIVEIMTQKNKRPSESWLAFAKTSHAKESIKAALRTAPAVSLKNDRRTIEIRLTAKDETGIIREISRAVAELRVKIKKLHVRPHAHTKNLQIVRIECALLAAPQLSKLLAKLGRLKGVKNATVVRK